MSIDAADFVKLLGRQSQLVDATRKALRAELRNQARVGARAAQAEVRLAPVKKARSRRPVAQKGLRTAIAAGIKVRFSTGASSSRVGVFIESKGASLDGDRRKLVKRWDSDKPFRHPVYGGPAWADQYGRPYFRKVIGRLSPEMTEKIRQALERAKQETMGHPL